MTERIFNFSAGPAVLPESVLIEARESLLSLGDTGIGILEHSHRGKAILEIFEETESLCRSIGEISDDYQVLFLQGGASTQFFVVPMNFLTTDLQADYLVTGAWSKKALAEAKRFGNVHVACSSEDRNFTYVPTEVQFSENPVYAHYTSNNTIFGTQFSEPPQPPPDCPLVCDASSDIFSRALDMSKFGLVYAGAQKNLGPSGLTLVIIRNDLVEMGSADIPSMTQYRTHAKSNSAYNTPPVFGIYLMGLVLKWIESCGGLGAIEKQNQEKAGKLYRYLDESSLFQPTTDSNSRSQMNITFVTGDADLDAKFIQTATECGLDGLKGHRSVGGMRASLYNAFPLAGVDKLIDTMREFETAHV